MVEVVEVVRVEKSIVVVDRLEEELVGCLPQRRSGFSWSTVREVAVVVVE